MTEYRVKPGDQLELHTISSAVSAIRAFAGILYDDGTVDLMAVPTVSTSSGRSEETFTSQNRALKPGRVTFAVVEPVTTTIKRGQTYVRLAFAEGRGGPICLYDYVYQNHWPSLGEFRDSGPSGGDGWLNYVTAKSAGAPAATTTVTLKQSNTRCRYYGLVWYYHASADVASRTLDVRWNNPILALPTGFAAAGSAADAWRAVQVTLTASEDGAVIVTRQRGITNDNGTMTIDSQASAPTPFPFEVREDDTGTLIFAVGSGNANDRDVIYVVREEWLVV